MRGINGTIMAYGQTGSGKTYSLLHPGGDAPGSAGLLPRLVRVRVRVRVKVRDKVGVRVGVKVEVRVGVTHQGVRGCYLG